MSELYERISKGPCSSKAHSGRGRGLGGILSKGFQMQKNLGSCYLSLVTSHPKTQRRKQRQITISHNSGGCLCISSADFTWAYLWVRHQLADPLGWRVPDGLTSMSHG